MKSALVIVAEDAPVAVNAQGRPATPTVLHPLAPLKLTAVILPLPALLTTTWNLPVQVSVTPLSVAVDGPAAI